MHKKGFEYFRISRKMSKLDVTKLLLPFFAIKGFSHYDGSALCRMFGSKKDVLYSYLSQDNINWRKDGHAYGIHRQDILACTPEV